MKNWIDRNLSFVLAVIWFAFLIVMAVLFSIYSSTYQEIKMKFPVDSVQKIMPVSTLDFEPKYKVYFNNGQFITTKNYQWASTADSIEVMYVKQLK